MLENIFEDILVDTCWIVSYVTEMCDEAIDMVISLNILTRVLELATHHNLKIQIPALRSLGNIIAGNNDQAQALIELDIVQIYFELMQNTQKRQVKKEIL